MIVDDAALIKGFAIGVAVAAPVGPMSVLCMRRTLTNGWGRGFATGAGIASGDAVYALVAAFGLAGVMRFVTAYERPLHLAAGAFLLYLGLRTYFTRRTDVGGDIASPRSNVAAFASASLLTLTNAPTIVSFVAIFTVMAPAGPVRFDPASSAAGVFFGSLAWWLALTLVVAAARRAVGTRVRRGIERISGAVLCAFGAAELRRSS